MLHVMLTGQGREAPSPRGLCGAAVAALYLSRIPSGGGRKRHLCPDCRALALKVAAGGNETVCAVGATHT